MTRIEAIALSYDEVAVRLDEAVAAVEAGDRTRLDEAMRLALVAMDEATALFAGAALPTLQ
jgi:hypothetical protein